jgi:hypothetical protein
MDMQIFLRTVKDGYEDESKQIVISNAENGNVRFQLEPHNSVLISRKELLRALLCLEETVE